MKLVALALLAVLGCGPKHASPASNDHGVLPSGQPDDPSCPLLIVGTSINVEDTPDGPSLVFVTTGDVAAVRTRGKALAQMHDDRNGPPTAMGMMFSPGSKATATDIDGGVRITFTPADPAKAGAVGDELRMHGHHLMGATSCEMHH